ncbi:MAG: hypothetical protein ABJC12_09460 [Saprospiraceae bacterium]
MKKILLFILLCSAFALQFCSSSKKAMADKHKVVMMSYAKDISPIISARCSPCHFPESGKKLPLNSYDALVTNVDAILMRVQLPQDDPHFMPWKSKKEPLSDSLIQVIKLWKDQKMPM